MKAWGDEDPPQVESQPPSPPRLRGRHIVVIGIVVAALGPVVSLTGALALGPMLIVLGLVLATFGACGWLFERLGAWDDDPGGSESIRLTDVAKLATRNRRH
jgi:hypothetical protein